MVTNSGSELLIPSETINWKISEPLLNGIGGAGAIKVGWAEAESLRAIVSKPPTWVQANMRDSASGS